ncbi:hypothetical protein [Paraburkholderia susongensis]|uniref:Uncharacterized protein n=1 Tax=Paraburkholderia susongensis TaxID=1515439 RepID=A0A1X7KQW6_9BURK|nr:hypothetical protein [Paraburkholderia susongensis]SMG43581.1 hypothetical protein SAMN06265784_104173 [Paraburkholderia susongensis]
MTHAEFLCAQAETHWASGSPLPVDLFMKMQAEGIDVDNAEQSFNLIKQYH